MQIIQIIQLNFVLSTAPLKTKICAGNVKRFLIIRPTKCMWQWSKMKEKISCNRDIMICNHEFDYFREVIDYDCDYIVFSMNVIDYDYEFAIVIVIVPTIAITDYDYPMPDPHLLIIQIRPGFHIYIYEISFYIPLYIITMIQNYSRSVLWQLLWLRISDTTYVVKYTRFPWQPNTPYPNVAQRYKADINDKVSPAGTVLPWNVTLSTSNLWMFVLVLPCIADGCFL